MKSETIRQVVVIMSVVRCMHTIPNTNEETKYCCSVVWFVTWVPSSIYTVILRYSRNDIKLMFEMF